MAVAMDDVRAALDPEEPNYAEAAKLGADALPHLEVLVETADPLLASKATYLASLIRGPRAAAVVSAAAQRDDPVVRVAAAAAASNLPASGASSVLAELVGDADPGVRKVARNSVPDKPSARLSDRLQELDADADGLDDTGGTMDSPIQAVEGGLMPGELPADGGPAPGGTMPGERPGIMPGEQDKMPGE